MSERDLLREIVDACKISLTQLGCEIPILAKPMRERCEKLEQLVSGLAPAEVAHAKPGGLTYPKIVCDCGCLRKLLVQYYLQMRERHQQGADGMTKEIKDMTMDELNAAKDRYTRNNLEGGEGYNPYMDEMMRRWDAEDKARRDATAAKRGE